MAMPGYGVYGPQEEEIEQRRRYAQALQQQSMQPLETNRMAGRVAVPISWAEGAAKLLQGYSGQRGISEAGEARKALASEKAKRMAELLGGMPAAQQQSTAGAGMTGGLDEQDFQRGAAPGDARTVQPTMQDRAAWLGQLAEVGPEAVSMGGTLMGMQQKQDESAEQRAFRAQEAQLAREQRMQELNLRMSDQRATAQERAAAQRELAQMNIDARREMANQADATRRDVAAMTRAQMNKPPAGFRFTPNGDLERIPGGPADLKAAADAERRASGAGDVDVAISTLRDAYGRLEKGGGIVSTEESAFSNVLPALASTGAGQAAGKLFGTNNQSARNDIAMARPALLAALMKATGMSAKQMDSNAELKLWLSTATDPTLDVQSNRRALDNIEKKYLSGAVSKPTGRSPQDAEALSWANANPNDPRAAAIKQRLGGR